MNLISRALSNLQPFETQPQPPTPTVVPPTLQPPQSLGDLRSVLEMIERMRFPFGPVAPNAKPKEKLDPTKPQNKWPANTWVGGACAEEGTAGWMTHTPDVMKRLKTAGSLGEAIQETEKAGVGDQHPVTMARKPEGWNKAEKKPRIALLIGGQGNDAGQNKSITDEMDTAEKGLKENFGKDDNLTIIRLPQPATKADIEKAMKQMKQFQKDHPDAESLVYYTGHGGTNGTEPGLEGADRNKEGAAIGTIHLKDGETMTETEMKALVNDNLKDFKHNLMWMDCCHSGAWIARRNARRDDGTAAA